MKIKKIYAAALAATMCCAAVYPTITANTESEALAVTNTDSDTVIVSTDTASINAGPISLNTVKSASSAANETERDAADNMDDNNGSTAPEETFQAEIKPKIDKSKTSTLIVKVIDDANDDDSTNDKMIGAGYTVEAVISSGGEYEQYTAETDKNGCVTFTNIPAGDYEIRFSGDNDSNITYMDLKKELTLKENIPLTLSMYTCQKNEQVTLKFAFCKYDGNTPDMTVKYPAKMEVWITNTRTNSKYNDTSDDNGIVSFPDIDPGTYTYEVKSKSKQYTPAVTSGTVTIDGSTKTMNIPTYINNFATTTVTFKASPWIIAADEGGADQTKIKYCICRTHHDWSGGWDIDDPLASYYIEKEYTYEEALKGFTYTFTPDDEDESWMIGIANETDCGYVLQQKLPNVKDMDSSRTYQIEVPTVIVNDVYVTATPDTSVYLYPQDPSYVGDYDMNTAQIKQTDANGNVVFENVPFGNYYVEDTATNAVKTLSVKKWHNSLDIEMPSKEECYIQNYKLYDMYDKLIEAHDNTIDNITKPESQGDRNAIYKVVYESGNPYSSTGTAIAAAFIRINADGTMTDLGNGPIGDGNSDGTFDIEDVKALQNFLLAADPYGCPNWQVMDLDCDNALTVFDLCLAKRLYIAKNYEPGVDIDPNDPGLEAETIS